MKIPTACLATLALAVACYSLSTRAATAGADDAVLAAQVHVLRGASRAEIASELDRIRAAGFNTIFLRVFQNSDDRRHALAAEEPARSGVYFRTERAPVVADLLGPVSELCRERRIKLFAWMTTRTMDWLSDKEEWRDRRWNIETSSLERSRQFDLLNQEFEDYLLALLGDLAAMPIDGIILQDDFVIKTFEGLTPAGAALFARRYGTELKPEELFPEAARAESGEMVVSRFGAQFQGWSRQKADRLTDLAQRLAAVCRSRNVNLRLAVNVYYDTAWRPEKGLEWLSQDLEALRAGPFDYAVLMAYHRQMAEELGISIAAAADMVADLGTTMRRMFGGRLVMKLQTVDWSSGEQLPADELSRLLKKALAVSPNIALAPGEGDFNVELSAPVRSNIEYEGENQ